MIRLFCDVTSPWHPATYDNKQCQVEFCEFGSTFPSAEASPKFVLVLYVTCLGSVFAGRYQYMNQ